MNTKQITRWVLLLVLLGVIVAAGYFLLTETEIAAQDTKSNSVQTGDQTGMPSTVTIQPASASLGSVSAAGNIELVSQHAVALEVGGVVDALMVKAGDEVAVGVPLLSLATTELERAIRDSELDVQSIQNELAQLMEEDNGADIAVAEAALVEAEENLADVLAGPSTEEIAAAQSSLSSAWAKYNELQAGPSEAELTQLSANLKKAEVALAEAQSAYNQVAWQDDVGMTSEAAALQSATIDYEAAKAAYAESTTAVDTSELQSALSAAQNAQVQLDGLLNSPTEAEIAATEARVVEAQANLITLLAGPEESEIANLEIALEQSLLSLEGVYTNLVNSTVTAPIVGTVLAVDASMGEHYAEGAVVVTLADTQQLKLTIDVTELDIPQVSVGQSVEIELDALAGQTFSGVVESVAPSNDEDASIVSYPVTIRLDAESIEGILPGMTAVASIVDNGEDRANGWLVPTNAIRQQENSSIVMVAGVEGMTAVEVIPGAVVGEWTEVESVALQTGDQVMGSVASFVNEEQNGFDQRGGGAGGSGAILRGAGGGGRP